MLQLLGLLGLLGGLLLGLLLLSLALFLLLLGGLLCRFLFFLTEIHITENVVHLREGTHGHEPSGNRRE